MADSKGASAWFSDSVTYPGEDIRRDLSCFLLNASTRPFGARSGRRPGAGGVPTVSGTAITVPVGAAVVDAAATSTDGAYAVSWKLPQQLTQAPADSNSPRTDVVYVRVDEVPGSPTTQTISFGYKAGNAASIPQAPTTVGDDNLPIARVAVLGYLDVPKAGGGDATVRPGPVAVAAGGTLPVFSRPEMLALTTHPGMRVHRVDSGALYSADAAAALQPTGRVGDPVALTSGDRGIDAIGGANESKFPNWFPLTAPGGRSKTWSIPGSQITRDSNDARLSVGYYAGINNGQVGFGRARIRVKQNGQVLSVMGQSGLGDFGWPDDASETDTWNCPVPVKVREGVAVEFSADITLDNAAGSAYIAAWIWELVF